MLNFAFGFSLCYGIFATIVVTKLNQQNSDRESEITVFRKLSNKQLAENSDLRCRLEVYRKANIDN